jgi:hypothetical protein
VKPWCLFAAGVALLALGGADAGQPGRDKRAECLALATDAKAVADYIETNWLPREVDFLKKHGVKRGFQLNVRGERGWVVRSTADDFPKDVVLVETAKAELGRGEPPHDLRINLTTLSATNCCDVSRVLVRCTQDKGAVRVVDE